MKNWIQSGDTVSVVAPADVASGNGVIVGSLFGLAVSDAVSGDDVEIVTVGVADITKAAGAITQGAKVYWDNTAKNVTTTVGTNTLIGCAVMAAANGDATVRVRLNGVV
ncbi:MAG: DUF2190 family protein [Nitrospirae bacterium]|nr:DUF2190 family protein [Magnetococcales bacterium]